MFNMTGSWLVKGQRGITIKELDKSSNKYILRAKMQDMVKKIAGESGDVPVWCGYDDVYVTDNNGNIRHIYIRES